MTPTIKTASWFTKLPDDCQRIGISRGMPRGGASAGCRMYRRLAPGPWFSSVDVETYARLYQAEVLDRLDPHQVAAELHELAGGRVPVLLCFERAGTPTWCHRALCAAWLAEGLGVPVPEFGYERLPQDAHPLNPLRNALQGTAATETPQLPF
jgi:hypothetical protein